MSSASTLPGELWTLIVAQVPCKDRHRNCSMVCSKLQRATAAASTQLSMYCNRAAGQSRSAELYLAHHGHQLTSLNLSFLTFALVQLPCANLQQLRLSCSTVQLGPDSNSPGILAACKRLTQLELFSCKVMDSTSGFSALAAVPKLQRLKLLFLGVPGESDEAELNMPSSILMHAPKLTCLKLQAYSGERLQDGLLQLSSLTDLQKVAITAYRSRCSVSSITAAGLSSLTALTSTCFRYCQLDPAIMQHSTQLQSFKVEDVTLICDPEDPPAASAMLLSCIARMTHLTTLSLSLTDTRWTDDITAYKALTASSKLQTLKLKGDVLVPGGIWQAAFPADRTCPQLQVLDGPEWEYFLNEDDEEISDLDPDEPESAANAADLARLASCCPALQDCRLCIAEDESLAPLAQLSSLSRLSIERVSNSSVGTLHALKELSSLYVKISGPVMPRNIMSLTALRRLTSLHFDTGAVPHADLKWGNFDLCLHSTDKHNPDVWWRLLKQCAGNRACQPMVIEGLLEQVASQQQQLAQQQDQCLQQQQHIESLQQQSALQQQCVAGLHKIVDHQQKLLVRSGEAAERRMQALEGQVQQLMQALQHRGI